MAGQHERRQNEVARLRQWAARSGGHLVVEKVSNDSRRVTLRLVGVPAPVGATRLEGIEAEHRVTVIMPPGYPETQPVVNFDRPLFHPNCWQQGTKCIGEVWYPRRPLVEVLLGVFGDMQLKGPESFNLRSAANLEAARAYRDDEFVDRLRRRIAVVEFPPPVNGGSPVAEGRSARRRARPRARVAKVRIGRSSSAPARGRVRVRRRGT